ncbi:MAG: class C beta-lactamase-related serine hydrolase, partial [Pedobacter sp.]
MKRKIQKSVILSLLSTTCFLPLSGAYSDPTFDINYYLRALSFPFSEPIKNYEWYKPKVKVIGQNIDLAKDQNKESKLSQKAIDQVIKYAEENKSLGLMIVHHGKVVSENYFDKWDNSLAGDSESMAKSVLSLLIGIAIDEGKINSVNDPVSLYLEEWRNDDRRRIKIKHLLEMTSGLRNSNNTLSPFSDLAKMHIGSNVRDLALNIPLEKSPGINFDYNNVNSEILGILIERVTGQKYYDYLSEKLWKPIGASDAEILVDNTDMAKTYCCLFAKMSDWSKLGLLVLNKGNLNGKQIVSKEWIEKMIVPSRKRVNYGLHIWLANSQGFKSWRISEKFVDETMIFFDGRSKQRVFILPKYDLVIVRVGDNSSNWKEDIIPN